MGAVSKKILIIEDDKFLSRALELKLLHEGFEVVKLPNGENVLETVKKANFNLIICDLMMPRVDGFEVLQILKDNKIKVPAIAWTNLGQQEDEKRAKDLGAVDFLMKSNMSLVELVEKIRQQVR